MPREFSAVIEDAGGGGAYVRVPFDAEAEFSPSQWRTTRRAAPEKPPAVTLIR